MHPPAQYESPTNQADSDLRGPSLENDVLSSWTYRDAITLKIVAELPWWPVCRCILHSDRTTRCRGSGPKTHPHSYAPRLAPRYGFFGTNIAISLPRKAISPVGGKSPYFTDNSANYRAKNTIAYCDKVPIFRGPKCELRGGGPSRFWPLLFKKWKNRIPRLHEDLDS